MDRSKKHRSSWKYAVPFFAVLAVLSILSFIIPLRPQVSYTEKRELKQFPEFSVESLISGSYFSELSLWFSDTFPGRESWLSVSQDLSSYHGYGDISIQGSRPVPTSATEQPTVPETSAPTEPETTEPTQPATLPAPTEAPRPLVPSPRLAAVIRDGALTSVVASARAALIYAAAEPIPAEAEPETIVPTEAPTEPVTTTPTEAPMEPETTVPTEAPTEPETTAPTEALTEPETTVPTDAPTEPATTVPTEPATEAPAEPETTVPTQPETTAPTEAPTVPEETKTPAAQRDESVLLDLIINGDSVIQMGDTVFYPLGFSQIASDLYIRSLNQLAETVAARGTRVISSVSPTAVGIIVPEEYLESIQSYPQSKILSYLDAGFSDKIINVDTVSPLLAHKDEYLFFHSDHHWTATAAYYCYVATCEAMGMEPAALDEFTEMNQGKFVGSIHGKATHPRKLTEDYVLTYDPIGNIRMNLVGENGFESPAEMIRDMRDEDENVKYIAFLHGDEPIVHIINDDMPEGKACLIIKDSFGNCFVPFFSKNYHDIYAIDYRKYYLQIPYIVNHYDIQDVIFAPNMMAVQSQTGTDLFRKLCGIEY